MIVVAYKEIVWQFYSKTQQNNNNNKNDNDDDEKTFDFAQSIHWALWLEYDEQRDKMRAHKMQDNDRM